VRREELFELLGELDEGYVREARVSGKNRDALIRWGSLAACVCLIAVSALWLALGGNNREETVSPTPGIDPLPTTSETYATLEDLLTHLSTEERHGTKEIQGSSTNLAAESQTLQDSKTLVIYGDYAYHADGELVRISKLSGDEPAAVDILSAAADRLLLAGDCLVLVDEFVSGGTELEEEYSARVLLYNVSEPETPMLREEYVQRGALTACFLQGETLTLLTSDGVCACGWSRLDDTADYLPKLTRNGETVLWPEEELCVLGEPSRVQYVAAVQINTVTGKVVNKCAFYGDAGKVYYSGDWLALTVSASHGPEVYTFSSSLTYTGKLEIRTLLGAEEEYLSLLSLNQNDGVWHVLALDESMERTRLLAGSCNLRSAAVTSETFLWGEEERFHVDHILWEENSAVITVTKLILGETELTYDTRLLTAVFRDPECPIEEEPYRGERVSGIEGIYWDAEPFGLIDSLIPLGKGRYLRYNTLPDTFELLERTENGLECVSAAVLSLPEGGRLDFSWQVYDGTHFGVQTITPDESGGYGEAEISWNVYALSGDTAELVQQVCLGTGAFDVSGFGAAEYDGVWYCAAGGMEVPIKLVW